MKAKFPSIVLLIILLQTDVYARNREILNASNKLQTIVKVKMVNASGCKMFFYNNFPEQGNLIDSAYKEENGYRVYTLNPKSSHVELFVIKYPPSVSTEQKRVPQLQFLLKKGAVIMIEGDAHLPGMSKITSKDQDVIDYEVFRTKEAAIENESWQKIREKLEPSILKDSFENVFIKNAIDLMVSKKEAWEREFVKMYPRSYAGLEIFSRYYKKLDKKMAEAEFSTFPDVYKKEGTGAEITSFFKALHNATAGNKVLPFKQSGIDNKMIDTDSLKGKVLIIDFWGSWCGPCRRSHPHLKELYNKYHDKGLEIIGIADEGGPSGGQLVWKKAVEEDGLPWLQLLNNPQGTDLVKMYAVTAFPTKLVVDRNGMIVLRINDSPEELDLKLKELFK